MRAIIQRVTSASVSVDNEVISSVARGVMVLVGIGSDDTISDMDVIANKILSLRIFDDNEGKMWKKNIVDIDGDILCVSQFTLMANTTKNKPDFHRAMASQSSKEMYAEFLEKMRNQYKSEKIQDGRFGAMMNVTLTNDGPVTFTLDSKETKKL
ncbi:D-Tyr tRNAtyr deacylase-like domain-containing protein [Flagelloscypha sp. PMI_526]|nr:D-Tyr tRNAtyr deacylase-like domain-containing protein [Flagelloscypha sp. PMI_526]